MMRLHDFKQIIEKWNIFTAKETPTEQASYRIEVLYEPHFREGANTQKQRMQKLSTNYLIVQKLSTVQGNCQLTIGKLTELTV